MRLCRVDLKTRKKTSFFKVRSFRGKASYLFTGKIIFLEQGFPIGISKQFLLIAIHISV